MIPGLILGAIYMGVLVVFYEKLKDIKKDELKEEELKGMNTPLGCLVSLLLFVAIYAAIIAGAIVVVKTLHLYKKPPAAISQTIVQPEVKNPAQEKNGKGK
jgi:hypothetical protein